MSEYIERDMLEDFAMNCVGGMVTMKQIHDFPAADKIMELITLKALADAKIERLEARLEQTRWIPVAERLPEPYEKVLTCDAHGNIHMFDHVPQYKHPFNIGPNHPRFYMVKYWMQLPAPPEEVEP